MKISLSLIFLLIGFSAFSQIEGKVTDKTGVPLPYVNIYVEGSFSGTTSNEKGDYELKVSQKKDFTIVFQFLGFKTLRQQVSSSTSPYTLNVSLEEETTTLEEVVVNSADNPANDIVRRAIERREQHKERIRSYTADFYSRGIWRIKNAPERILGIDLGDLGGGLDSTRSGILYLSETISKITYEAPNNFKEKIIASKVSGQDNGFSLNTAQDATLSFYNNTISLNSEIISPLADRAFSYYRYKLEGVFYNDGGNLINKIQVIPRRPKDRIFSGYIYIIEDTWQIYGIDLKTTGEAMQVPPIEELVFKQNFNYSEEMELWIPISQTIDFEFGMFGISGDGRFTAVYTNYDFNPNFGRNTFSNEILSFEEEANKKDSLFWNLERPVPLTFEEQEDYHRKDSLEEIRNSRPYLDSLDKASNKFGIGNLLTGYTYRNSYENWALDFSSPLFHTHLNTVQGYNTSLETSFRSWTEDNSKSWRIYTNMNYGFSDERLRVYGGFEKRFNNKSRPILNILGGTARKQINDLEPITETINGIATNFFERNYLKLYELTFAEMRYQEEIFNGLSAFTSLAYEYRSPLFNHWNSPWVDKDHVEFTSNNPLEPQNFNSAAFEEHGIFKLTVSAQISFGQKYLSYPDGKYNIPNDNYPRVLLSYEKGFGADIDSYNFDHLKAGVFQNLRIGNKGTFGYNLIGGTFFNDKVVSYLDYRHFKGNQTRIGSSSNYLDRFNLLPYYELSTQNNFFEAHFEHNFKGWVLGKLPLINTLNFNLVLGAHRLAIQDQAPYSEVSIGLDNLGIGKFRFLRLDYVLSSFQGKREGAFIFGLKFLNVLTP